jgi:hypothetical protein
VTFRVLAPLANEAAQPACLIALLLLFLMITATFRSTRPRAAAAAIGGLVAALVLIKINVGVFAGIAVLFAAAAGLSDRWKRSALTAMGVLIVALPLVLMASLRDRPWVLELAIVESLSAAALAVAALRTRTMNMPATSAGWLFAGGAAVTAVCLAVMIAGGTSLGDMWVKSIAPALRFPQVFVWPPAVNAGYDIWAGLALVGVIAVPARYARPGTPAAGLLWLWAGFFIWVSVVVLPSFLLALPLTWMAVHPPGRDARGGPEAYSRFLLSAVAVVGSLQLFPVAGTQQSVAALLLIPIGAIALNDGVRQLRSARPARLAESGLAKAIGPIAFGIAAVEMLLFIGLSAASFANATPLGLPGAQSVRLPVDRAVQLRALVGDVDRSCTSFVTYPGMNSFYFWTAKDPPVEMSSEVWWLVLDSGQQQALVDKLANQPGLCVVKNQRVIDFWAEGRSVPDRPLVEFIDKDFVVAGSYGDYVLLVRGDRSS